VYICDTIAPWPYVVYLRYLYYIIYVRVYRTYHEVRDEVNWRKRRVGVCADIPRVKSFSSGARERRRPVIAFRRNGRSVGRTSSSPRCQPRSRPHVNYYARGFNMYCYTICMYIMCLHVYHRSNVCKTTAEARPRVFSFFPPPVGRRLL
jgi:hypothetical protein